MRKLKSLFKKFIYFIASKFPVNSKQVLFFSYYGAYFGCSPKYIYQKLLERNIKDIKIIWAFTNPQKHKDLGVKVVKYGSPAFISALCRSKVICTNFNLTSDFKKRKDQLYILTYHNTLRLKRTHADTISGLSSKTLRMLRQDAKKIDYLCCGSRVMHSIMQNSFGVTGKIINSGLPRNDILINNSKDLKLKIREKIGIKDENTKILLYAPTFRKQLYQYDYNLNVNSCIQTLKDITGNNWVSLLRLHPHLLGTKGNKLRSYTSYLDITNYDDVSEILLIADVLITDYSSIMFDFCLQKKPVFLFAEDIDNYSKNDFGFYFDFQTLPFPFASSTDLLLKNIQEFNYNKYLKNLESFDRKIGSFEDGNSSYRLVDLISSYIL